MNRSSAFERLPLELLQMVVTSGDGEVALALSSTSRSLRNGSYDNVNLAKLLRQKKVTIPGLTLKEPTRQWAQWALADAAATKLLTEVVWRKEEIESATTMPSEDVLAMIRWAFLALPSSTFRWLPHLMTVQHHILLEIPTESLAVTIKALEKLREQRWRHQTPILIASAYASAYFCLAAKSVCTALPRYADRSAYPFRGVLSVWRPLFRNRCQYAINLRPAVTSFDQLYTTILGAHAHANGLVAAMTMNVRHMLRTRSNPPAVTDPFSHDSWIPQPPTTVPSTDFVPPLPPFSDNTSGQPFFSLSHVHRMTDPSVFNGGVWTGYVFTHAAHDHCVLRDISFRAEELHSPPTLPAEVADRRSSLNDFGAAWDGREAPGDVHVMGEGIDYMTQFGLNGMVCRTSGWVSFEADAGTQRCQGVVTPFGIVGTWGDSMWGEESITGGWFWMFRKDWSKS